MKKILSTALVFTVIALTLFSSCGSATKHERIFTDTGERKPAFVQITRTAEGDDTVNTQADNVSVTLPATSPDGAAILDFLSYFYYGDEVSPEYVPNKTTYTFTVSYENGDSVSCGLEYAEIGDRVYTTYIDKAAASHPGLECWHTHLTNTLAAKEDISPLTELFSGSFATASFADTEDRGRYYYGYFTDNIKNIPHQEYGILLRADSVQMNTAWSPLAITNNPLIVPLDKEVSTPSTVYISKGSIVVENSNTAELIASYRSVTLPTLKENEVSGYCDIVYGEDLTERLIKEYEQYREENPPETEGYLCPLDPTEKPDYDWSGHIFPLDNGREIVKIEYMRDAYGEAATGIETIDSICVDAAHIRNSNTSTTSSFDMALEWITSLVKGEAVTVNIDDREVVYTVRATYSDGTVIECDSEYISENGVIYEVTEKPGILKGLPMYSYTQWILDAHSDAVNALDVYDRDFNKILSLVADIDATWTLTNGEDASLKGSYMGFKETTLSTVFYEEIPKPTDISYSERLEITAADGSYSFICYNTENGITEYRDANGSKFFRTHIMHRFQGWEEWVLPDLLINSFKRTLEAAA